MLAIIFLFAPIVAKDPKLEIAQKDALFSSLFNSQNFEGVAKIYHPDALLITPNAEAGFLKQPQLETFFNQTFQSGMHPISLAPKIVEQQGTILHEIGTLNGVGKYYVRWIPDKEAEWLIAFDCMAIGAHGSAGGLNTDGGRLPKRDQEDPRIVLGKLYKAFIQKLDSGDVDGAYKFIFSEDNRNIYADGESLNDRDASIAAAKAANFTMTSSTPLNVFEESSNLWHEIGRSEYKINGVNQPEVFYYSRWERQGDNSPWKSKFFIENIGE